MGNRTSVQSPNGTERKGSKDSVFNFVRRSSKESTASMPDRLPSSVIPVRPASSDVSRPASSDSPRLFEATSSKATGSDFESGLTIPVEPDASLLLGAGLERQGYAREGSTVVAPVSQGNPMRFPFVDPAFQSVEKNPLLPHSLSIPKGRRRSWGSSGEFERRRKGSKDSTLTSSTTLSRRSSLQEIGAEAMAVVQKAASRAHEVETKFLDIDHVKVKDGELLFRPHTFDAFTYTTPRTDNIYMGKLPVPDTSVPIVRDVIAHRILYEDNRFYLAQLSCLNRTWIGLRFKSVDEAENKRLVFVSASERLELLADQYNRWDFSVLRDSYPADEDDEPEGDASPARSHFGMANRMPRCGSWLASPNHGSGVASARDNVGDPHAVKDPDRSNFAAGEQELEPSMAKGAVYCICCSKTNLIWGCAELPQGVEIVEGEDLPAGLPWLDMTLDAGKEIEGAGATVSVLKQRKTRRISILSSEADTRVSLKSYEAAIFKREEYQEDLLTRSRRLRAERPRPTPPRSTSILDGFGGA